MLFRSALVTARLEYAIMAVTRAEHVYIGRFSEAAPSVHFHLFPRTQAIAAQFLRENPDAEHGVNGPLLFDWARRKYHVNQPEELSAATIAAAKEIRAAMHPSRLGLHQDAVSLGRGDVGDHVIVGVHIAGHGVVPKDHVSARSGRSDRDE